MSDDDAIEQIRRDFSVIKSLEDKVANNKRILDIDLDIQISHEGGYTYTSTQYEGKYGLIGCYLDFTDCDDIEEELDINIKEISEDDLKNIINKEIENSSY